jgi:hypothetical protein
VLTMDGHRELRAHCRRRHNFAMIMGVGWGDVCRPVSGIAESREQRHEAVSLSVSLACDATTLAALIFSLVRNSVLPGPNRGRPITRSR